MLNSAERSDYGCSICNIRKYCDFLSRILLKESRIPPGKTCKSSAGDITQIRTMSPRTNENFYPYSQEETHTLSQAYREFESLVECCLFHGNTFRVLAIDDIESADLQLFQVGNSLFEEGISPSFFLFGFTFLGTNLNSNLRLKFQASP